MNSGIYMIKNLVNSKVYIGKSKEIMSRWKKHQYMLNNNLHHALKLQEDWNVYGKNSFSFIVLELCPEDKVDERERAHIEIHKAKKYGYNSNGNKINTNSKKDRRNIRIEKLLTFGSEIVKDCQATLVYLEDLLEHLRFDRRILFLTLSNLYKHHYEKYNTVVHMDCYGGELVLCFSKFDSEEFDNVELWEGIGQKTKEAKLQC